MPYGPQRRHRLARVFTLSYWPAALGIAFGAVELFDVSFALGAFFTGMVLNESGTVTGRRTITLPLRDALPSCFVFRQRGRLM
ncbi:hypothetical protein KCP77_19665 [Salmonella enterica subsp. enterica]|nr:hypothetical protein KCP77_19665 [Salmonella enterica subsp. enterica]